MIVGLIIILVFPFIYFYTQMNNFNQKTNAIKTAINEKKETYIDPLTGKMHWTENGEQIIWTEILSVERNIPEGCIVGDKVLRGVKTGRVYRNKSYEDFKDHVQWQLNHGECWCFERRDFIKNWNDVGKEYLRYHMKNKFFYTLQKEIEERIIQEESDQRRLKVLEKNKYYMVRDNNKIEIDYNEYKRLGGV